MENENKNLNEEENLTETKKKPKKGLIIGISAAAAVIVIGIVASIILLNPKDLGKFFDPENPGGLLGGLNPAENAPEEATVDGVKLQLAYDKSGYTVVGVEDNTVTEITIPEYHSGVYITAIDTHAFEKCTNLEKISIPDTITSISYKIFTNCTKLKYNEYDNARYLGNKNNPCVVLMKAKDTSITSCEINNNTKVIGDYAFSFCTGLTSITIPNSVTSIGEYAFSGCRGLESVTIPDSVISIGEYAFSRCRGLESVTIPDSVISIGEYAFYDCAGLKSITIPNNVTSIGEYAFSGCRGLESITISDSVTSIGSHAFYGCTGLKSVTFGESSQLESIGYAAFRACRGLESITIPDSVTSIGYHAFVLCSSLVSINFNGAKAEWSAIEKDDNWNYYTGEYVVHCTDGDLTKAESEVNSETN